MFAARERLADLQRTLDATVRAGACDTVIDLLVNGDMALADEAAQWAASMPATRPGQGPTLRVWYVALGDKSHAWNQYLHLIWPGSGVAFFIDGYVRPRRDALKRIDEGLAASPGHLAATGVPSVGRTAAALRAQMLRDGGIHGNLYALTRATMERLRNTGFKLPLGLYRTDPTLGAALAFGLDPAASPWNLKDRILVHPQATWDTDEKRVSSMSDLSAQLKRRLRQGQGSLENRAVHDFFAVRKQMPQHLPPTAAGLVFGWSAANPWRFAAALARQPIAVALAARRLRKTADWSAASVPPVRKHPRPSEASA